MTDGTSEDYQVKLAFIIIGAILILCSGCICGFFEDFRDMDVKNCFGRRIKINQPNDTAEEVDMNSIWLTPTGLEREYADETIFTVTQTYESDTHQHSASQCPDNSERQSINHRVHDSPARLRKLISDLDLPPSYCELSHRGDHHYHNLPRGHVTDLDQPPSYNELFNSSLTREWF